MTTSSVPPRSAPRRAPISAFPTRVSQLTGALLDERYKIQGTLEIGTRSRSYLAEDLESGGCVELRMLTQHSPAERERAAELWFEFPQVVHPNLVEVLGIGRTGAGLPYLVTEALRGESLAELITRGAPLSVDARLVLLRQSAAGLAALHRICTVHTAFGAHQVLVLGDASDPYGVKVLDHGLIRAWRALADEPPLELGRYLAPEQIIDAQSEAGSDVYAFGVVLLEALRGELLAEAAALPASLEALAGAGIDPRLVQIVRNATRQCPQNRYSDLQHLLADLNAVLGLSSHAVTALPLRRDPDLYEATSDAGRERQRAGSLRLASPTPSPAPKALHFPATRRDAIEDEYFGERVADPYRWLEAGADPEVRAWIDAQNQLTESVLGAAPERSAIRARLAELLALGSVSLPSLRRSASGEILLFFTRRQGEQEQPVLYVRAGLHGDDRALVDPTLHDGGSAHTALDWFEPSLDGSLLAYGISHGGSEDSTLYLLEVASGTRLRDVIPGTQHASIAWLPGNERFFYTRYPIAGDAARLERRVFEHRVGRDPLRDPLIFGEGLAETDFASVQSSPNGRWLVITVSRGWSESAVYLCDLERAERTFQCVTPEVAARYTPLIHDDALYLLTNAEAERYRLLLVDPRTPNAPARELVPEHPADVLYGFELARGEIVLLYLHAGAARLERVSREGAPLGTIAVPMLGSCSGVATLHDSAQILYGFESFVLAPQIRSLDLQSGAESVWQSVDSPLASAEFAVEEAIATSADGTQVPYQLVRRRDLPSGPRPTLLYGYGGFNETIQPRFSRSLPLWLERGYVYVQALLRGGGEFGEAWHRAAQREQKQHSFDDFRAVADALIDRGVTSANQLAALGRSNGGLLVAAVTTQQPGSFAAVVAGVPLTDMLRFPRFLIGKLWQSEYGSPENEAEFRALWAYSPYHRTRPGVAYPAVLVTTAESDTRVDPLHARKWVAALQHATSSERPVLLRTERVGGHGAGSSLSQQLGELSDVYTFLISRLAPGSAEPGK